MTHFFIFTLFLLALLFFIFKKCLFIYFERKSASRAGAEKKRETQNPKQAPGSELSAHGPMWGSISRTTRS